MSDDLISTRFKAVTNWCLRYRELAAGWPNFYQAQYDNPSRIVYGHYLLPSQFCTLLAVPRSDYTFSNIRGRFSAAFELARKKGFEHGFPTFNDSETEHELAFFNKGVCHVVYIPSTELGLGTDPMASSFHTWFMRASDYAATNGYSGAMPTGRFISTSRGLFYCAVCLFKSSRAQWRDIRGNELGLPDVQITTQTVAKLNVFSEPNDTPVTGARRVFADEAVNRLTAIVNDDRFIEGVRNGNYSRARIETATFGVYKDPIPNNEIVELIRTGKEQISTADDEIDLEVKLTTTLRTGVIGSTTIRKLNFRTSNVFFNEWYNSNPKDYLSLAAHWMHEWLHVAGFRHVKILVNGRRVPDRSDAVYSIGRLVVEIGRQQARDLGMSFLEADQLGEAYIRYYNRDDIDEGDQAENR